MHTIISTDPHTIIQHYPGWAIARRLWRRGRPLDEWVIDGYSFARTRKESIAKHDENYTSSSISRFRYECRRRRGELKCVPVVVEFAGTDL